jgi:hypothetical protein
MIPPDDSISGNPSLLVDNRFEVQQGTHVAHRIHQTFYHSLVPEVPVFHRTIDAHRPELTDAEWDRRREETAPLRNAEMLDAGASLVHISRQ